MVDSEGVWPKWTGWVGGGARRKRSIVLPDRGRTREDSKSRAVTGAQTRSNGSWNLFHGTFLAHKPRVTTAIDRQHRRLDRSLYSTVHGVALQFLIRIMRYLLYRQLYRNGNTSRRRIKADLNRPHPPSCRNDLGKYRYSEKSESARMYPQNYQRRPAQGYTSIS